MGITAGRNEPGSRNHSEFSISAGVVAVRPSVFDDDGRPKVNRLIKTDLLLPRIDAGCRPDEKQSC
jgi:hypothetical protein